MFKLKEFRRDFGLNQIEIAKLLNCKQPNISAIEKGKDLTEEQLSILIDRFGETIINKYHLKSKEYDIKHESSILYERKTDYINHEKKGVPFYNVDFIGGFDVVDNNQTITPAYYIDFSEYNNADMWINVTGKSMEPTLWHGDKISVKELNDWNTYLLYGEIYAIVTDEYRTVKIIRKSSLGDDYIKLIPINPDFDEQDIPKTIVKRVFTVLGSAKKLF